MERKDLPTLDYFRFSEKKLVDAIHFVGLDQMENFEFDTPHISDYYLIRIIRRGSGSFYKNYIPHQFSAGSVIVSAPKDVVFVEVDDPKQVDALLIACAEEYLQYLNIDRDTLGLGNRLLDESLIAFSGEDFEYLWRLAVLIFDEYEKNPSGTSDRLLPKLIETFVYLLIRNLKNTRISHVDSREHINIYKQFTHLLYEHAATKHFVADYIDLMNINEKRLNRVCKKITGFSALQIIHKQLDQEIKQLLFYTSLSNKEISRKLGFNDTTHLYKFFRKLNKMTPKEYKKKAQQIW